MTIEALVILAGAVSNEVEYEPLGSNEASFTFGKSEQAIRFLNLVRESLRVTNVMLVGNSVVVTF